MFRYWRFLKWFTFLSYVFFSLAALSCDNVFFYLIFMEISNLFLMFFFWAHSRSDFRPWLFFLISVMSGLLLFVALCCKWDYWSMTLMCFKMGMWPFGFWMMSVSKNLSVDGMFFFLALSKLVPMYGLMMFFVKDHYEYLVFMGLMHMFGCLKNLYSCKFGDVRPFMTWVMMQSSSVWLLMANGSLDVSLILYGLYICVFYHFLYHSEPSPSLVVALSVLFLGAPPFLYLGMKIVLLAMMEWSMLLIFFYL